MAPSDLLNALVGDLMDALILLDTLDLHDTKAERADVMDTIIQGGAYWHKIHEAMQWQEGFYPERR